jgi:hypothetical protein
MSDRVQRILDDAGLPDGPPMEEWSPTQIETLLALLSEVKLRAAEFMERPGEDRQQWDVNLRICDRLIRQGREAMRRVRS